jgi:hypothetical protein
VKFLELVFQVDLEFLLLKSYLSLHLRLGFLHLCFGVRLYEVIHRVLCCRVCAVTYFK